jgi:hypothetical protein
MRPELSKSCLLHFAVSLITGATKQIRTRRSVYEGKRTFEASKRIRVALLATERRPEGRSIQVDNGVSIAADLGLLCRETAA